MAIQTDHGGPGARACRGAPPAPRPEAENRCSDGHYPHQLPPRRFLPCLRTPVSLSPALRVALSTGLPRLPFRLPSGVAPHEVRVRSLSPAIHLQFVRATGTSSPRRRQPARLGASGWWVCGPMRTCTRATSPAACCYNAFPVIVRYPVLPCVSSCTPFPTFLQELSLESQLRVRINGHARTLFCLCIVFSNRLLLFFSRLDTAIGFLCQSALRDPTFFLELVWGARRILGDLNTERADHAMRSHTRFVSPLFWIKIHVWRTL